MRWKAIRHATHCDVMGCRSEWQIRLSPGATLINPSGARVLCSECWSTLLREEDKMRASVGAIPHPKQKAHHSETAL